MTQMIAGHAEISRRNNKIESFHTRIHRLPFPFRAGSSKIICILCTTSSFFTDAPAGDKTAQGVEQFKRKLFHDVFDVFANLIRFQNRFHVLFEIDETGKILVKRGIPITITVVIVDAAADFPFSKPVLPSSVSARLTNNRR